MAKSYRHQHNPVFDLRQLCPRRWTEAKLRYLPSMRCFALFLGLCFAAPATAWEFTPGVPCILSDIQGDTRIELTHDPRAPLYSLSITRAQPWDEGQIFSMTYLGPRGFQIATSRQTFQDDGRTLRVEDRGFGNVLDGMEYNGTALANLGDTDVRIDLEGAAEPVREFRRCSGLPTS